MPLLVIIFSFFFLKNEREIKFNCKKKKKLENESALNNQILESVNTLTNTLSRLSVVGGPPVVFTSPQLSVQNQKGFFSFSN